MVEKKECGGQFHVAVMVRLMMLAVKGQGP